MKWDIITHSPEETRDFGRALGQRIQFGLTIRLNGDLGSGKTCLVQGLARGLAVPEGYDITSPTYTLINEYPGRMPFYHADLYRLEAGVDAESLGLGELFDTQSVLAVEWEERLDEGEWPDISLKVELLTRDDETRRIRLIGYGLETDNLIRETLENWKSGRFQNAGISA